MQWPSMVFFAQDAVVQQAVDGPAAVVLQESYTSFMPSATWMWKPVMPSLALTIFSKVLSEMVNRAWPPNMALIMSSSCSLAHLAKSAFS